MEQLHHGGSVFLGAGGHREKIVADEHTPGPGIQPHKADGVKGGTRHGFLGVIAEGIHNRIAPTLQFLMNHFHAERQLIVMGIRKEDQIRFPSPVNQPPKAVNQRQQKMLHRHFQNLFDPKSHPVTSFVFASFRSRPEPQ